MKSDQSRDLLQAGVSNRISETFTSHIMSVLVIVISSYLEFKRLFSSTRLNCLVQKLICRTQIRNGVNGLGNLFLLNNLTWRRAHVTAGLTGRANNEDRQPM